MRSFCDDIWISLAAAIVFLCQSFPCCLGAYPVVVHIVYMSLSVPPLAAPSLPFLVYMFCSYRRSGILNICIVGKGRSLSHCYTYLLYSLSPARSRDRDLTTGHPRMSKLYVSTRQ